MAFKQPILDTANSNVNPLLSVAGTNDDASIRAAFSVHIVAAAPTAADGGAGLIGAGTYRWAVTTVNAEGETPVGAASAGLTLAASHQASLSAIPTGPTGTTARKLYRAAIGGTTWGLVGTLADNTTTTFTDNLAAAGSAPPGSLQYYTAAVHFTGGAPSNTAAPSILNALQSDRTGYGSIAHPERFR